MKYFLGVKDDKGKISCEMQVGFTLDTDFNVLTNTISGDVYIVDTDIKKVKSISNDDFCDLLTDAILNYENSLNNLRWGFDFKTSFASFIAPKDFRTNSINYMFVEESLSFLSEHLIRFFGKWYVTNISSLVALTNINIISDNEFDFVIDTIFELDVACVLRVNLIDNIIKCVESSNKIRLKDLKNLDLSDSELISYLLDSINAYTIDAEEVKEYIGDVKWAKFQMLV